MKRKQYSIEQKAAAVARFKAGESAIDIADELKIHPAMVYQWRRALKKKPAAAKRTAVAIARTETVVTQSAGSADVNDGMIFLTHAEERIRADWAAGRSPDLANRLTLVSVELLRRGFAK